MKPLLLVSVFLAVTNPHSGKWTEGMTPEDEEIYTKVYRKRLDQEGQDAMNIQEYIKAQTPSH